MGLFVRLDKRDEDPDRCTYVFGPPDAPVGRAVLRKDSGDIELIELESTGNAPGEQYYLAHAVSRLRAYHDREVYPDADRWEV